VNEALFIELSIPGLLGDFKQGKCSDDVGLDERVRTEYRAVYMAFSGEVDDGVDFVTIQHLLNDRPICDVSFDKRLVSVIPEILDILQRTGVRQQVKIDNVNVSFEIQNMPDEVTADETGAAGDEYASWMVFPHCLHLLPSQVQVLSCTTVFTSPARDPRRISLGMGQEPCGAETAPCISSQWHERKTGQAANEIRNAVSPIPPPEHGIRN
jgi:hypothetical protein